MTPQPLPLWTWDARTSELVYTDPTGGGYRFRARDLAYAGWKASRIDLLPPFGGSRLVLP